eukprot:CAMPEP_0172666092 /NCGR_PEP_ID=MMETSP1074-20121228/7612_1 /TAXON_ID=2916 /ORGANISM="Ceratium fusus, Strain PA161109" /LENGTH=88 /DNA_ID=CAMNT_0013482451 /DNA_START=267 /DNA_END=534 /DNA_ORIENTATION=-
MYGTRMLSTAVKVFQRPGAPPIQDGDLAHAHGLDKRVALTGEWTIPKYASCSVIERLNRVCRVALVPGISITPLSAMDGHAAMECASA